MIWIGNYLMTQITVTTTTEEPGALSGWMAKSTPQIPWFEWLISLAVVVLLIVILAAILRRIQSGSFGNPEHLKQISVLALGQKERAILVQVGEEQVLLGVAPGQVRTLHVLKEPVKTENTPDKKTFGSHLQAVLLSHKQRVAR